MLFEISDNSTVFLSVSVLLIIIGVFVAVIGIVGTAGAVLASITLGRILLGLVSDQNLHALALVKLAYCHPGVYTCRDDDHQYRFHMA